MKKKNKKKSLKIIMLIIILLILIALIILVLISRNKKPRLTEERAQELLYNSYVYYVLSSGNVPLNDYKLSLDGKEFYGIDINVHSLKEMSDLLKDTFSELTYYDLTEPIYNDSEKNFSESNDILFINKVTPNEKCQNLKLNGKIHFYKSKDEYIIEYKNKNGSSYSSTQAVYENGKWVLYRPIIVCFSELEEQKSE